MFHLGRSPFGVQPRGFGFDAPAKLAVGIYLVQTIVTGARATAATQGIDSNSRVIDMSDTIHLLDPNLAPLTAILMKIRKAHAINPKVEWLEDDYLPTTDTVNGTIASTVNALVVDNGDRFRARDVLKVLETGETLHVTSVSSNTLTIVRTIGSTAAATITDGDTILIIGSASQEGATTRTVKTTQKTPQYNYTQIYRWPFSSTGTLQASELYGGDDLTYQARKAGMEHKIAMERGTLFGERNESVAASPDPDAGEAGDGTTPIRFEDGVIARISTNVTDFAGLVSKSAFETFLRTGFRYGPARKMFFASRLWVSILNEIAGNNIETIPTTRSFPLALTEYVSGHGKLYIVTHNLLTGNGGSDGKYQSYGLLLDLDSIFYRYLQGRDTRIKTNIQAPDEDARKDEYLTEKCTMTIQEQNHSIAKGATGAA